MSLTSNKKTTLVIPTFVGPISDHQVGIESFVLHPRPLTLRFLKKAFPRLAQAIPNALGKPSNLVDLPDSHLNINIPFQVTSPSLQANGSWKGDLPGSRRSSQ